MTDPIPLSAAALADLDALELAQVICPAPMWASGGPDEGCRCTSCDNKHAHLATAGRVIAFITARRPTAPSQEGEAVAWRWKYLVGSTNERRLTPDEIARSDWQFRGSDPFWCEERKRELEGSMLVEPLYTHPAKPVDGEVVERLTKARDRLIPLGQSGEDYIWRPAKEAVQAINALLLLVAAMPLGGEDMADLSKTDRLSGSLTSDVGYEERADLCREIEATLSAFPMHNSKNEGFYRAKASVLRRALEILRTQGTTPPPSADKSGDV